MKHFNLISIVFRSGEFKSMRKPRLRRARLCVNAKPRIRVSCWENIFYSFLIFLILLQVGYVSSSMRREDGEVEGEDSDTDEEVFDNPSDAGRREETVELIKWLENIVLYRPTLKLRNVLYWWVATLDPYPWWWLYTWSCVRTIMYIVIVRLWAMHRITDIAKFSRGSFDTSRLLIYCLTVW